ncbi:hypothetical protein GCM10010329_83120 [Streptomyces spiroverticillatus]|uniref:Uncharacterized protein n=1 Tax=Streptomyces finlayi TaxID=67296 RepID=A0A918X8W4_9ACTN|nr:hypothetical protein GCM10010329_83120 [Streptomyces spiroverticillatus]GHD18907.1 hypothetical protein GCM10010334_82180 [Streptomyces finlayi]
MEDIGRHSAARSIPDGHNKDQTHDLTAPHSTQFRGRAPIWRGHGPGYHARRQAGTDARRTHHSARSQQPSLTPHGQLNRELTQGSSMGNTSASRPPGAAGGGHTTNSSVPPNSATTLWKEQRA